VYGRSGSLGILLGVLLFGSIFGLSEVALGDGLKATGFPYRSALLTGMGMGIMGAALALYRKPAIPFTIGLVGASVKLLAIPILGISIMCKANSCLAVALEASALSLVAFVLLRGMDRSIYIRMGAGALAAMLGAVGFFFIGMRVAPCNYLLSFQGNLSGFLGTEGSLWAAFSALLLPLGWWVGEKIKEKAPLFSERKPLYYFASTSIIFLSLGMSAWVIGLGF